MNHIIEWLVKLNVLNKPQIKLVGISFLKYLF